MDIDMSRTQDTLLVRSFLLHRIKVERNHEFSRNGSMGENIAFTPKSNVKSYIRKFSL